MATCDLCLREYVIEDDLRPDDECDECDECASWREYWLSLTPEEQRAEELAMAEYAVESEREGL
jgi:hypothetical protein